MRWWSIVHRLVVMSGLVQTRPPAIVQELITYTSFDPDQLELLGRLLNELKADAHGKAYKGRRDFHFDSEMANDKPVSISISQPATNPAIGAFLFQGDILLTPQQAQQLLQPHSHQRSRRSFTAKTMQKWTQLPIKYKFDDTLGTYEIGQIRLALAFWQNNTCLSFENDPLVYGDHIEFFKGKGCYSMIGRAGGRQGISIGEGCEAIGVIEHEIGHSLGVWHTQSRPDADCCIEIDKDFIKPIHMFDFLLATTKEIDTLGVPYDYGSVMHYGPTAFSKDEKTKTVLTRDSLFQRTIGQRESPSFFDIKLINTAYCTGRCDEVPENCENGGYRHPADCGNCICPSGFGGQRCAISEPPLNARCGGQLDLTDGEWMTIESPGYSHSGYQVNQRCSWLVRAPSGYRILLEFVDEFGFLCSTTCLDYVELKIRKSLDNTGYRFCCYDRPKQSFVSEDRLVAVIFRSQVAEDVGFRLRMRITQWEPTRPMIEPLIHSTSPSPSTIPGTRDIWTEWSQWSTCSKTCGACGVRQRLRQCVAESCSDKAQEYETCAAQACQSDQLQCDRISSLQKKCLETGDQCLEIRDSIAKCAQPTCCPPFYERDGVCYNDQPYILN